MERIQKWWLKNVMLVGVLVTGTVLLAGIAYFVNRTYGDLIGPTMMRDNQRFDLFNGMISTVVFLVLFFWYERPIRRYIELWFQRREVDESLEIKAKRRVLNESLFIFMVLVALWLISTPLYMAVMIPRGHDPFMVLLNVVDSTNLVLIVVTLTFFLMEGLMQLYRVPFFFPQGKLHQVPGVRRINLRVRFAFFFAAVSFVPVLTLIRSQVRTASSHLSLADKFTVLSNSIWVIGLVTLVLSAMLALVLVNNLTRSVNRLTGALSRVAGGDFSARVTVRSNDEIGYAGEVVNEMTEGLAERERLRAALQVAQEVQLNLLPRRPPKMAGLDLAGASLYCDETGGDYFDFLQPSADEMSVLVGDVSGHGVPAALLMTTARGFLRQRAALGGDPVHIVTDVNAALCRDVGESGRFMTLFYAAFDGEARRMTLVNAGHEPALLYDPDDDAFQNVGGRGLALGVIPGYGYRDRRLKMKPGQILVLATDGVWETTNAAGRPFGRDRLKALIRENRDRPAEEAVRAVIEAVEAFREGLPRHDDVTLVLIKAEADGNKGRPS